MTGIVGTLASLLLGVALVGTDTGGETRDVWRVMNCRMDSVRTANLKFTTYLDSGLTTHCHSLYT